MFSRRELLLSVAAGPFLRAQEPIRTDVNVVNIYATVRNKQGQVMRDLAKEDFLLDEEGRAQTIRYFSKESDLPLTLGLVVDTSGSMRRVLEPERNASGKFFDQVLREDKDQAFLIHFDAEVELLQDLTSSRKQLQRALQQLDVAPPRQLNRRGQDPTSPRPMRAGTSIYDAVLLACDELMRKQTGRKAIILLSDGVDNASRVTLTDAIESAQKADTLVYTILFEDEDMKPINGVFNRPGGMGRRGGGMGRPQAQHPDGKKIMERIAKETGAGFFEANKKLTIDQIFAQVEEELRNQYSLGYTPETKGAGYRTIRLTTTQKGLIVQARDGYYAAQ